jgi:hypothetical protein
MGYGERGGRGWGACVYVRAGGAANHSGFIPELQNSLLHYFSANYYPKSEIYTQRRSRRKVHDIPGIRFYVIVMRKRGW